MIVTQTEAFEILRKQGYIISGHKTDTDRYLTCIALSKDAKDKYSKIKTKHGVSVTQMVNWVLESY